MPPPARLLALAFAFMPVVSYEKFNVDSPVALLNEPLLDLAGSAHGAQLLLGLGTIVLTVLLASRRRVAVVLAAVAVLAAPGARPSAPSPGSSATTGRAAGR